MNERTRRQLERLDPEARARAEAALARAAAPEARAAREQARVRYAGRPGRAELIARGAIDPERTTTQGAYRELLGALAELKAHRVRLGLSLTDVSERSGLDRAAISKLEGGHNPNPTFETLARYAAALGVPLRLVVGAPAAGGAR